MNLALFAFGLIFIILLLYWVFSPWLVQLNLSSGSNPLLRKLEKLYFDREMILENLQDLELDRAMGKIDAKDYETLKLKMMNEAATIYQTIEKIEHEDPIFIELQKYIEANAKEPK